MPRFVALNCTSIAPNCPVENTIYGYAPSLPLTFFFLITFFLLSLLNLYLGFRHQTYFYAYVLVIGTLSEAIGYIGRYLLHKNPYSNTGFRIQITCLIYAPAFIAAGIYITLKHIVLTFGTKKSRIPAIWYTWIFITCDMLSLILQAAGGGMAGGAGKDAVLRAKGTDIMIAGIVWQVFTLLVFALLVLDYIIRTSLAWDEVPISAQELSQKPGFRLFITGVIIAFIGVFCRCVYRIAEMVGGWANPIMRDEVSFVVMEGFMIFIAALVQTVFHPGYCLPQMSGKVKEELPASDEGEGSDRGIRVERVPIAQHLKI